MDMHDVLYRTLRALSKNESLYKSQLVDNILLIELAIKDILVCRCVRKYRLIMVYYVLKFGQNSITSKSATFILYNKEKEFIMCFFFQIG